MEFVCVTKIHSLSHLLFLLSVLLYILVCQSSSSSVVVVVSIAHFYLEHRRWAPKCLWIFHSRHVNGSNWFSRAPFQAFHMLSHSNISRNGERESYGAIERRMKSVCGGDEGWNSMVYIHFFLCTFSSFFSLCCTVYFKAKHYVCSVSLSRSLCTFLHIHLFSHSIVGTFVRSFVRLKSKSLFLPLTSFN